MIRGSSRPCRLLTPALAIVALLFGGGLAAGVLQVINGAPPGEPAFHHFQAVLADPDFGRNLLLTLHISLTSTAIAAAASLWLALMLASHAEKSRLVHFLLQIPLTIPHLAAAIAFLLLLAPSGLVSRLWMAAGLIDGPEAFPLLVADRLSAGIILVYVWKEIPFLTFMLLAVLKNSGRELLEVGATLNATRFQRFLHITLPVLTPALASGCLVVFAFTFGAFEVPYLLGRTYPVSLPVWAYKTFTDVDLASRPEGVAIGLIIAAIVICAILLSQLLFQLGQNRRETS